MLGVWYNYWHICLNFQEQYVFLYDAVLETVLCGFTEISAENLKTEIERLQQKELNKSISEFEVEFNVS